MGKGFDEEHAAEVMAEYFERRNSSAERLPAPAAATARKPKTEEARRAVPIGTGAAAFRDALRQPAAARRPRPSESARAVASPQRGTERTAAQKHASKDFQVRHSVAFKQHTGCAVQKITGALALSARWER